MCAYHFITAHILIVLLVFRFFIWGRLFVAFRRRGRFALWFLIWIIILFILIWWLIICRSFSFPSKIYLLRSQLTSFFFLFKSIRLIVDIVIILIYCMPSWVGNFCFFNIKTFVWVIIIDCMRWILWIYSIRWRNINQMRFLNILPLRSSMNLTIINIFKRF